MSTSTRPAPRAHDREENTGGRVLGGPALGADAGKTVPKLVAHRPNALTLQPDHPHPSSARLRRGPLSVRMPRACTRTAPEARR